MPKHNAAWKERNLTGMERFQWLEDRRLQIKYYDRARSMDVIAAARKLRIAEEARSSSKERARLRSSSPPMAEAGTRGARKEERPPMAQLQPPARPPPLPARQTSDSQRIS